MKVRLNQLVCTYHIILFISSNQNILYSCYKFLLNLLSSKFSNNKDPEH